MQGRHARFPKFFIQLDDEYSRERTGVAPSAARVRHFGARDLFPL
jgi:hypothetical protein